MLVRLCWYDLSSCFEGQWRGSREQLEELGVVLISMPLMCTSSFFALVSHERGYLVFDSFLSSNSRISLFLKICTFSPWV